MKTLPSLTSNKSVKLSVKRQNNTAQKLGTDSLCLISDYDLTYLPYYYLKKMSFITILVRVCCIITNFVKFRFGFFG